MLGRLVAATPPSVVRGLCGAGRPGVVVGWAQGWWLLRHKVMMRSETGADGGGEGEGEMAMKAPASAARLPVLRRIMTHRSSASTRCGRGHQPVAELQAT